MVDYKTYYLEGNLYYGGGLKNLLKLIGEYCKRKFLKTIAKGNNLNDKQKWEALVGFRRNYLNRILVCWFHAKDEINVNLFEEYKSEFIFFYFIFLLLHIKLFEFE